MKITAIDSFAHGAKQYTAGDSVEVTKSTAEDMRKVGLVSIEEGDTAQTGVTDSQEDLNDLVGGEKMADEVENKMAPAPTNKKAR